MNNREKVVNVFTILHDGTIVSWAGDKNRLRLTISCSYLAEKIDNTYESFALDLLQIGRLVFVPWMNPAELEQEYLIELDDIFKAKLDIHSAENDNDLIKVSCNQRDSNFDYCGGFLYIACDDIEIFDQSGSKITTSRLDEIFKEYWADFVKERMNLFCKSA